MVVLQLIYLNREKYNNQNTNEFFVANKFANRVDTWHHKCVDTWYHKRHKVHIRSDRAIVYIMNICKAWIHECNDVRTGISIHYE